MLLDWPQKTNWSWENYVVYARLIKTNKILINVRQAYYCISIFKVEGPLLKESSVYY